MYTVHIYIYICMYEYIFTHCILWKLKYGRYNWPVLQGFLRQRQLNLFFPVDSEGGCHRKDSFIIKQVFSVSFLADETCNDKAPFNFLKAKVFSLISNKLEFLVLKVSLSLVLTSWTTTTTTTTTTRRRRRSTRSTTTTTTTTAAATTTTTTTPTTTATTTTTTTKEVQ